MARRDRKLPLKMGIMGAIVGGLNFKLSQNVQKMADEAEMRKLDRLEQIQIAREGRQEIRDVAREERGFAHEDKKLDSQQQHDVALTGLRHEYGMQETQAQINARLAEGSADRDLRRSEGALDRETQLKVAQERAGASDTSILGSDGNWYERGTPLPAGVAPMGGSGMSWAPSASKGLPKPGTKPGQPVAPRRDFTGFSIAPAE